MNNRDLRNAISNQCGFGVETPGAVADNATTETGETLTNHTYDRVTMAYLPNKAKPYAVQACNAGDWPERLSESFGDWLKQGDDAIDDPGGNIIPSRVLANHDQYDNERHPFK